MYSIIWDTLARILECSDCECRFNHHYNYHVKNSSKRYLKGIEIFYGGNKKYREKLCGKNSYSEIGGKYISLRSHEGVKIWFKNWSIKNNMGDGLN